MSRDITGQAVSRRELCAAALSVLGASVGGTAQAPVSAGIDQFFQTFTAEWIRQSPDLATRTRYFAGEEQDRLERQLTPVSISWKRERIQLARRGLAQLHGFDQKSMNPTQRLSAELLDWQLQIVVDEEPFLEYTFPLEQMNGANVNLVENLTVRHPLLTGRDAENYVAALGQVAPRMEEAIQDANHLAAKNVIPPRFILQATIRQMQGFTDPAPSQNPFVTAFAEKIAAVNAIPQAKRNELRTAAENVVGSQVYPAYKKATALLQSQLPRSTSDAGLWRLPGGPEAYLYTLRRFTTTKATPDEIHETGLKQVARIEGEMDRLLRSRGRRDGSVKERVSKLSLDLQYPNPASEASRAQIMRDIDGILADAQKRSMSLFDVRPKSLVVARAFPRFREANAAANYNQPPLDGSQPAVFQYPRRVEKMTRFGLRSTVYHETVPGHHFQIALELENRNLPRFRQVRAFGVISALNEGWGLYAERLAAESGWYGDDVEGRLGQLDSELFRARRLVVDTGLHAKRWTRQQAIDYGIEASEVERYVVLPGQACSYMVGELKILELREKAKAALGARFSLREFHDTVLETGTGPLEILERAVQGYVQTKA
jgi:uncharacterized protein (DUF885 family)